MSHAAVKDTIRIFKVNKTLERVKRTNVVIQVVKVVPISGEIVLRLPCKAKILWLPCKSFVDFIVKMFGQCSSITVKYD